METNSNYTEEDQKFWREGIIPALENVCALNPDNKDLAFLNQVIRNRMFLGIKDFNFKINGVGLRINPSDTKETAQTKLFEFLNVLAETSSDDKDEDKYTTTDQDFWRNKVIPSLAEITKNSPTYANDPGFKLLNLTIERRMLTATSKASGLDITVGSLRLKIPANTKKALIQKKLESFLEQLKQQVSAKTIAATSDEVRSEFKSTLKRNWSDTKQKRTELLEKPYRYTPSDKLYWDRVIMPNIEDLSSEYQNNKEFQSLVNATKNRQFLTTPTWHVAVGEEHLQIEESDSQDDRQSKLGAFLDKVYEKAYTKTDKRFWRQSVIPALTELAKIYPDDENLSFLTMVVNERSFLEARSLLLTIGGVKLDIQPSMSKREAQEKLGAFLKELRDQSSVEIIKTEMKRRIQNLEEQLRKQDSGSREKENQLKQQIQDLNYDKRQLQNSGLELRQLRQEKSTIERKLKDAETELKTLKSSYGYSSYRPSYSASGE